jgi:hypothetical protein
MKNRQNEISQKGKTGSTRAERILSMLESNGGKASGSMLRNQLQITDETLGVEITRLEKEGAIALVSKFPLIYSLRGAA